jgi:hypothetical protein
VSQLLDHVPGGAHREDKARASAAPESPSGRRAGTRGTAGQDPATGGQARGGGHAGGRAGHQGSRGGGQGEGHAGAAGHQGAEVARGEIRRAIITEREVQPLSVFLSWGILDYPAKREDTTMRTFYKNTAGAVIAGTGAAVAALFLMGGPLAAHAQTNACITNGATGATAGSNPGSGSAAATNRSGNGASKTASAVTGQGRGSNGSTGSRLGTGGGTGSGSGNTGGSTGGGSGSNTGGSTGTASGPILSVIAPVTGATTSGASGTYSTTTPINVTVGQGSSIGSSGAQPLVTVRAPVNGNLTTGSPSTQSTASSPVDVVVGRSTDPDANGSLVNVNTPVNVDGSAPGTPGGSATSLPTTNAGQGSGSLVNVSEPLNG